MQGGTIVSSKLQRLAFQKATGRVCRIHQLSQALYFASIPKGGLSANWVRARPVEQESFCKPRSKLQYLMDSTQYSPSSRGSVVEAVQSASHTDRREQLGMGCLHPRVGSTGKRPFSVSVGQGLAYPQKGDVGSPSGGKTVSDDPHTKKCRVSRRQHYDRSLLARRRWRRPLDDKHGQASLASLGPSGSLGIFSAVDTRKHFEPGSRLAVSVGGHRRLGARSTDSPALVGLERRLGGLSVRRRAQQEGKKVQQPVFSGGDGGSGRVHAGLEVWNKFTRASAVPVGCQECWPT